MTANPTLVKLRGIDEESVRQINLLHEKLDNLMSRANLGVFQLDVHQRIETIEYALQSLWKFDTDHWNVVGVLDDRPSVLRMWREVGIENVISVADPYIEF